MENELGIVIVNWNTKDALVRCVSSILQSVCKSYSIAEITIVDNASTDRSLELLSAFVDTTAKKDFIQVIKNQKNLGFAKACNQGAKKTKGNYFLFLNPDTKLFVDTLENCFCFLNQKKIKKMGVLGVSLYDDNGKLTRSCSRLPKKRYYLAKCLGISKIIKRCNLFMLEWDHQSNRQVEEVIGAFFLVPAAVFWKFNGFDERFFVYYEEVDFCKRLKENGYVTYYLADARAVHTGHGSSAAVKEKRLFYEWQSRMNYFLKYEGVMGAAFIIVMIVVETGSRVLWLLLTGRRKSIVEVKKAFCLFLRHGLIGISRRNK